MTLLVFTVSLCLILALGVPVAFALLITGMAMLYQMGMFDVNAVAQYTIAGADNYQLLAVPFFMLAGELMNAGGISKRIIAMAVAWVGHLKGGLGYVVIVAALLLSSLSGSAVADAAVLTAVLLPMMRRHGYDQRQAAGLISAGAVTGPIIPPSISFIVFGVTANVSITQLFFAGIAPGIIMGGALALTWWSIMRRADVKTTPKLPASDRIKATAEAFWGLLLPFIIIFGMRGGIFTATEAAVVAAVYALVVGLFVYRELKLSQLLSVFVSSAKTTAVVMFLVACSYVSAYAITLSDLPTDVTTLVEPLIEHQTLLMLALMLLLVIVGAGLDITPTILILAPILMPIVIQAEIDPVYFGVMFVINGSIGLITPPVGTILNVVAGVGRMTLDDVIHGSWIYMAVLGLVLLLFILFPALITVPAALFHR